MEREGLDPSAPSVLRLVANYHNRGREKEPITRLRENPYTQTLRITGAIDHTTWELLAQVGPAAGKAPHKKKIRVVRREGGRTARNRRGREGRIHTTHNGICLFPKQKTLGKNPWLHCTWSPSGLSLEKKMVGCRRQPDSGSLNNCKKETLENILQRLNNLSTLYVRTFDCPSSICTPQTVKNLTLVLGREGRLLASCAFRRNKKDQPFGCVCLYAYVYDVCMCLVSTREVICIYT